MYIKRLVTNVRRLNFLLDFLVELLEILFVGVVRRPADPQALLFIGFVDDVKVHMVYDLVRDPAIVLQDVVVLELHRDSNLLCGGHDIPQLLVRDLVQFGSVRLGKDERVAP